MNYIICQPQTRVTFPPDLLIREAQSHEEVIPEAYPAVDIRELAKGYEFIVELPGYDENRIRVSIQEQLLTITASPEDLSEEGEYLQQERNLQEVSRSFLIPDNLDLKSIRAFYKNGLLTLHLTKLKEAMPQTVPIESG